ncbi:MAG: BrnT family toxin [Nitrosomonas sp.]|nr:BrnT family toxin [Nitrosomonas sp.]
MSTGDFQRNKKTGQPQKHGIDFIDAQLLWNDPRLLEIPAKTEDEPRYLIVGVINNKHWSAVITYREANVRLVSVRRSRIEKIALYES